MRVKQVAIQLKVSPSVVRTYVQQGRLECDLNPGGQRVFSQAQVDAFTGKTREPRRVFYVRSSSGNKEAMVSQERELTEKFGQPLKVYSDAGSGMSENRRGLARLLRDASKDVFNEVCVTYEDRLTRFGANYLVALLEKDDVTINVANDKMSASIEEELLQDFMSLLASFSGRFYRLRSKASQRQLLEKAQGVLSE